MKREVLVNGVEIRGWRCRLPMAVNGPLYHMLSVDEATPVDYEFGDDDLPELKTFIFYDGSREGWLQAKHMALDLALYGEAVRYLGRPGIVAVYPGIRHTVYERRKLESIDHDRQAA